VASHGGAAALRARNALPAEVARALGVTLLVEGTVQREGERVRVTLRVIDAALESTVWSRTLDGRADAALALQDLAAASLVGAFGAGAPATR
jgi:eukaryotic-like serine/threonine-protein kinase